MSKPRQVHTRALILALFVTMLWSSSWVLIRWGLEDERLPPILFAGLRYGTASMVLIGLVSSNGRARHQVRSLSRKEWVALTLLGLVFVTAAQGAQFVAIANQPAATSSLVLSLTPLIVAMASAATLGEQPSRRQVIAAGVIVIGAATYFSGDIGFTTAGMLASGVGLAANAAAALMGRRVNRGLRHSPLVVTAVSMGSGAVVLLVIGIVVEGLPRVTPGGWVLIGWLAVVNTALAFTLWNRSLQHLSATESSAINNTMLVQIALLAWIFLDELPGPLDIIGMVLVSVGVYLAQRKPAESIHTK
jgi:drug/metabolite transporter (DMT)-like permease